MAINKIYMRIEGSKGISEWFIRHPFSLEEIRHSPQGVRARYDVVTSLPPPRDAKGPGILGIIVYERTGVEADAAEGEADVER